MPAKARQCYWSVLFGSYHGNWSLPLLIYHISLFKGTDSKLNTATAVLRCLIWFLSRNHHLKKEYDPIGPVSSILTGRQEGGLRIQRFIATGQADQDHSRSAMSVAFSPGKKAPDPSVIRACRYGISPLGRPIRPWRIRTGPRQWHCQTAHCPNQIIGWIGMAPGSCIFPMMPDQLVEVSLLVVATPLQLEV